MQLGDLPAKLRYPFLIEYLVERHLLAQAAVKQGVADFRGIQKAAGVLPGQSAARCLFQRLDQTIGDG